MIQMDTPVTGFALDDCVEVLGDDLARVVRWADGPDVSRLAGIPVRLRFELKDADLFSFRFSEKKEEGVRPDVPSFSASAVNSSGTCWICRNPAAPQ